MQLSESERAILRRYDEKCRIAGGAHAGYLLRLAAIERLGEAAGGGAGAVDGGLAGLVEKGLLKATEVGDRYYLTEAGAELLQQGGVG
jgi:hypothetical protein